MFIPYQAILIPLVQMMQSLGLYGSIPGLIFVHVVYGLPITTLIFRNYYAGIPTELVEAARIDGASTWRAFKDITLPQMRSAIVFVTTVQLIASFQVFGQVFIMTNGGPGDSTQTLVMFLYRVAFRQQEFGYAAAIGYFLFVVLVAVSLINYKFVGGDD
jgi:multiple sugar transport system permease protein